jgi:hypothetical protein
MIHVSGSKDRQFLEYVNIQSVEKDCTHFTHFCEKINRARRIQFSPHETATQKVFSPPICGTAVSIPNEVIGFFN